MLSSFVRVFDYADFENKLRRYFSDTAPIYATVEMMLQAVRVTSGSNVTVSVSFGDEISVKNAVGKVIECCEQRLYPQMLNLSECPKRLPPARVQELLLLGFSIGQIREKYNNILKRFVITRFNRLKNSIDYRDIATGEVFRAHLNRPLVMCRDTLLRLSESGRNGMRELYQFITDNAEIEELKKRSN
jgi:hypothetical protein